MKRQRIRIFVKTRILLTIAEYFVPTRFTAVNSNAAETATTFKGKNGIIATK
jgi:hypothetical protein